MAPPLSPQTPPSGAREAFGLAGKAAFGSPGRGRGKYILRSPGILLHGMVRDAMHTPRNRGGGATQIRTPAGLVGRQWDEFAHPSRVFRV